MLYICKLLLIRLATHLIFQIFLFLGGYLSQRLLSQGYSVGATRKIVETVCMGTEMICLVIIGKLKIKMTIIWIRELLKAKLWWMKDRQTDRHTQRQR